MLGMMMVMVVVVPVIFSYGEHTEQKEVET